MLYAPSVLSESLWINEQILGKDTKKKLVMYAKISRSFEKMVCDSILKPVTFSQ